MQVSGHEAKIAGVADFMMLATAPVNALAGLAATGVAAAVVTHKLLVREAQNIEVVCASFSLLSISSEQHGRRGEVYVEVIGPGQNVVGHGAVQCSGEATLPDQPGDAFAIRATRVIWAPRVRSPKEHSSDSEEEATPASSPLSRLDVATLRFTLDPGVTIYGFAFAD